MNAPLNHRLGGDLELLFTIQPLLNILRGDKRERLHRAFVDVALGLATTVFEKDETALPASPREALLALHKTTLDLCARGGVARVELTSAYNEHGESGTFENGGIAEAAERALALLALFHARRLQGIP
jgi:hypothetical protein